MAVDVSRLTAAVLDLGREKAAALGESFVLEARAGAPYDTGELVESIQADPPMDVGPGLFQVHVFCGAEYGRWQDEGTGVYGPTGSRIYPKSARALVFPSKSGGMVFAASVAGSPPTLFWQRAIASWGDVVAAAA